MYLKQIGVEQESKVNVVFEKVVDDLLMISLVNDSDNEVLSYWRLTEVAGIPPLEVGINCKNNSVASITFYIDSTHMVEHGCVDIVAERGAILVDSKIFTHTNEYLDVHKSYSVQIQNNNLICFFEDGSKFKYSYKTDKLEVFLDEEKNIVGFAICDLSSRQINMIDTL